MQAWWSGAGYFGWLLPTASMMAGIDYSQALAVCRWLDITPGPQLLRQLSTISTEIMRLSNESPNA